MEECSPTVEPVDPAEISSAPLSDFIVGQWLLLVATLITIPVVYTYTAGLVVGENFNKLTESVYQAGLKLGAFVFSLSESFAKAANQAVEFTEYPAEYKQLILLDQFSTLLEATTKWTKVRVDWIVKQVDLFFTELAT